MRAEKILNEADIRVGMALCQTLRMSVFAVCLIDNDRGSQRDTVVDIFYFFVTKANTSV